MDQVRNVNVGRGYGKTEDAKKGFESATKTNRTFLAMEYLLEIVKDFEDRLTALESAKPVTAKRASSKAEETTNDGKE